MRKLYCSFRISCHDLEIERGRYIRPRKPPEERLCKLCYTESETEIHFLTKCIHYSELRKNFYAKVSILNNTFNFKRDEDKFEYLMTSKNDEIIKNVMKFIFEALKVRKEKLCKI